MPARTSPWPAALTSAGIGVVVAVVLSLGLATITASADDRSSGAVAGADGVDGVDGRAGADGRDGIDGRDGTAGVDGAVGPRGANGVDGRDGVDGLAGADGADGLDGADGATGAMGPAGADGAPGAPGPAGAPGADGLDGAPGLDAAVAFAEAETIVGTYTVSNGLHLSSAKFPIASNVAPGNYVLVFNVPRITHDIGIPNQPLAVDCRLTGPATVTGASNFVFLPASGLRSYSVGEGPSTRGTIWNTSAIRAVTVTGTGPIGVECWSAHSNASLPAPDPSVELHAPSALLLRAP